MRRGTLSACRHGRQPLFFELDATTRPSWGVHRVASLVKRWLLGTHQGTVEQDHLQDYLDEFAFRFNPAPFGVSGPALPAATRTGGTGGPRRV